MPGDTPMTCTVYRSKLYAVAGLVFVLGFAYVFGKYFTPFHTAHRAASAVRDPYKAPVIMRDVFALIMAINTVALIHSLVSRKIVVRVDEAGFYYRRGTLPSIELPVIAWADVLEVGRAPKVSSYGGKPQTCLRDGWRPLRLSLRNPDKYLSGVKPIMRTILGSPSEVVQGRIQIDFLGLTPGSDVVEACIRQHLARMGRPQEAS